MFRYSVPRDIKLPSYKDTKKKKEKGKKESSVDVIGNADTNTKHGGEEVKRATRTNFSKGRPINYPRANWIRARPIFSVAYRAQDQLLIKARIKPDLRYLFYISTSLLPLVADSMKPVVVVVVAVASPIFDRPLSSRFPPPLSPSSRGFNPLQPDSSISQSSKGCGFYEPRARTISHTIQRNVERGLALPTSESWQYSTRRAGKFPLQSYGNARLHLSRI